MISLTLPLWLGSNSPRRRQILADAGFVFETKVYPTDEDFPASMPTADVPGFLAKKKAEAFHEERKNGIVLTADTVVRINDNILNKPQDYDEAFGMLRTLSGKPHLVTTGFCVATPTDIRIFSDTAVVYFRDLTDKEIAYYIATCRPFDKAGSYGVQDFIGMVGIPRIEGSYFTVMGLPIHLVYDVLKEYMVE